MTYTYKPCACTGCNQMARRWSRYCERHTHRVRRYGSADGRPVDPGDLQPFELMVDAGLERYSDRTAVHMGHELASEVLGYRSERGFTYENDIERAMTLMNERGITARDVLRRVVAFAAYMRQYPHKFPTAHAEEQGVARAFLRLLVPNPARPGARYLRHLGSLLKENLFPFAYKLLDQLARDATAHAERVRASTNFDERISS